MTLYIAEIALFHKEFVSTKPSVLARSALALARCILSRAQAKSSEWAGAYDPQTVMGLSNHLYQPSQVLSRKYGSAHLSSVSATVDEFLQRQAQIARRAAAPPTPPAPVSLEEPKPAANGYLGPQTPQKTPYGTVMQHGALTPPITPGENEQFANGYVAAKPQPGATHVYPATPTPGHPTSMQQQPQFYANTYLQPHAI
jgi:hypothetical protein